MQRSTHSTHARGASSSWDRLISALDSAGIDYKAPRFGHADILCPVHNESHASLHADYVSVGGKTVLNCKVGCDFDDILTELGLTAAELFDDWLPAGEFKEKKREEERQRPASGGQAKSLSGRRAARRGQKVEHGSTNGDRPAPLKGAMPKSVAWVADDPTAKPIETLHYDYTDAQGVVTQRVVRLESAGRHVDELGEWHPQAEKSFRQRYPKPDGKGWFYREPEGWSGPVLYRLPDVLQAVEAGELVRWFEGEKDADLAASLDLCATANVRGAKGKLPVELVEALRGARVQLVLDLDGPGLQRAELVVDRLEGIAAEVTAVVPAIFKVGSDFTDHIDAGFTVEQLLPVDVTNPALLALAGKALTALRDATKAACEVQARTQLAAAATAGRDRTTHLQAITRWVRVADDQLERVAEIECDQEVMSDEMRGQWVREASARVRDLVRTLHELTGTEPDPYFARLLDEHTITDSDSSSGHGNDGDNDQDNVTHLGRPFHELPFPGRGRWAYSLGDDGFPRGVYMFKQDDWIFMAPLPYVLATIQHRDGAGRATTKDYLVASTPDGQGAVIDPRGLSDGSWANTLGLSLGAFPQVIQAAATAIEYAGASAPMREETPRINPTTQLVDVSLPETLPDGYMALADIDREPALDIWRQVLARAASSPVIPLAMGAAAAAPWLDGLSMDAQAWIFALYGDRGLGKTTLLTTCGAIYGYPKKNSGVVVGLNSTANGVPALLGQLGCLPAFLDEFGQLKFRTSSDRANFLMNIAEGASRLVSTRANIGSRRSRPWCSVAFMTGNGDFIGDVAGADVGIERRIIQFPAPITASKEAAAEIKALVQQAYGHLGQELLSRYTVADVRGFLDEAGRRLDLDSLAGKHHSDIAELLRLCVAGAMMLDDVTGQSAEGTAFYPALEAAVDYLDQLQEPPHDADKLVDAILELLATSPSSWPTTGLYGRLVAERGYDFLGVLHELKLEEHIGVFPSTMADLCARHGIDQLVALRELHKRGWLHVTGQVRKTARGFQQTMNIGVPKRKKVYQLTLPPEVLDGADESAGSGPTSPTDHTPQPPVDQAEPAVSTSALFDAPSEPVTTTVTSSVTSPVTSDTTPLTSTVTSVTSSSAPEARTPAREDAIAPAHAREPLPPHRPTPKPCVDCGEPTTGRSENGQPLHLGSCSTEPKPTTTTAPVAPTATKPRERHEQRPVAVADLDGLHLGAGEVIAYPNGELPQSVWQLVDLAFAHGVGFGSRISKDGPQVFITTELAAEVNALIELPANPQKADKLLAEHSADLAWIAPDRGWSLSEGQNLQAWCFGRHVDGRTARIVHLPYCDGQQALPGLSEDSTADDLADRLTLLTGLLDLPFRISAATTGHDTMRLSRPRAGTRRDNGITAPTLSARIEFPEPFTTASRQLLFDGPFARRPRADEGQYLHMWDTNGAYPRATSRLYLGDDSNPIHFTQLTSDDLNSKQPGIVLAQRPADWSHPYLASPWAPTGLAEDELDQVWMPTTTALWLREIGYTLDLDQAWLWEHSAAYLDPWATRFREGRKQLLDRAATDPHAAAILPAFKGIFRAGIGKLSDSRLLDRSETKAAWFRPDYHSLIRGNARALIQRFIVKTATATDRQPVIVLTDAVGYLSTSPDPIEAWPGDPAKLSDQLGGFKHEASARVDDELIARLGRVPHIDAVMKVKELLTDADEWRF